MNYFDLKSVVVAVIGGTGVLGGLLQKVLRVMGLLLVFWDVIRGEVSVSVQDIVKAGGTSNLLSVMR